MSEPIKVAKVVLTARPVDPYAWEPTRIEEHDDLDSRCWVNNELGVDNPCNRPAPNGAGLCDYHLEILKEKGR